MNGRYSEISTEQIVENLQKQVQKYQIEFKLLTDSMIKKDKQLDY